MDHHWMGMQKGWIIHFFNNKLLDTTGHGGVTSRAVMIQKSISGAYCIVRNSEEASSNAGNISFSYILLYRYSFE